MKAEQRKASWAGQEELGFSSWRVRSSEGEQLSQTSLDHETKLSMTAVIFINYWRLE